MKISKIYLISALLIGLVGCQDEEVVPEEQPVRYLDLVFDEVTVERNIVYGSNLTQGGNEVELLMDIYTGRNDSARVRPLLVLAHGGSFIFGDKTDIADWARNFARAGYVVASINYRLIDVFPSQREFSIAIVQAMHDMKASVRYFYRNVESFKIDTSQVLAGGYSAGAFTALHYGYMRDSSEVKSVNEALWEYLQANGGFEGNSGNAGYSSRIAGVLNVSGALGAADFLDAGEPFLYSVHGTADEVVPYSQGNAASVGITTEGSGLIHERANEVGLDNQLKTIEGGGHDAFQMCSDCEEEMRAFVVQELDL